MKIIDDTICEINNNNYKNKNNIENFEFKIKKILFALIIVRFSFFFNFHFLICFISIKKIEKISKINFKN